MQDLSWKATTLSEHILAGELLGLSREEAINARNSALDTQIRELKSELEFYKSYPASNSATEAYKSLVITKISTNIIKLLKVKKNTDYQLQKALEVPIENILEGETIICCRSYTSIWPSRNRLKCWKCGKLFLHCRPSAKVTPPLSFNNSFPRRLNVIP